MDELLKEIYYDPTQGYIGIDGLYRKAKKKDASIKRIDVDRWLSNQEASQINKQKNIREPHLPIFSGRQHSYQMDLAFIPKFKQQNRGYHVLLTVININTRKAYAYKAKNKNTKTILERIKQFYRDTDEQVNIITSDNGSEFIAKSIQDWGEDKKIEWYFAEPENHNKLGIIERFNRTLKERLNNYFTATGKPIWYNVLDEFIENYNDTYHRGIKMKPNDMKYEDEKDRVLQNMYKTNEIKGRRGKVPTHHRIAVDDIVRIKLEKGTFTKIGKRFSNDFYKVEEITPVGYFKLRSLKTNRMMKRVFKWTDVIRVSLDELKTIATNQDKLDDALLQAKQSTALQKEQLDLGSITEAQALVSQQQKEKDLAKQKKKLEMQKKKLEKQKKSQEEKRKRAKAFMDEMNAANMFVIAEEDGDKGKIIGIELNEQTGHYRFLVRFQSDNFEKLYTKSEIQGALKKVNPQLSNPQSLAP